MNITRHRNDIQVNLSPQELIFLVNHLGSDPQTTEGQETVTQWLKEIVRFVDEQEKYYK